ncbi:hypothetical protein PaeBR_03485 [Paenibacillus sp. BR2-3]|uniref:AAA family ATPase n=1 Tax=Paenibacillus sp. BR2-3 TaxID=3048494 RepID=UPI003977D917
MEQATEDLDVEAFKLNTANENKPGMFEVVFIHQNILYRYGFVADKKRIFEEWLFNRPQLNKNKENVPGPSQALLFGLLALPWRMRISRKNSL